MPRTRDTSPIFLRGAESKARARARARDRYMHFDALIRLRGTRQLFQAGKQVFRRSVNLGRVQNGSGRYRSHGRDAFPSRALTRELVASSQLGWQTPSERARACRQFFDRSLAHFSESRFAARATESSRGSLQRSPPCVFPPRSRARAPTRVYFESP